MPEGHSLPESLREKALRWEGVWGVPGLMESVTIEFSLRFRTTLGLCRPAQGRIRLAAGLLVSEEAVDGGTSLMEEVLCHELAHVAVHRLHGRQAKPHGPEWKRLVREAGFEPRLRMLVDEVDGAAQGRGPAQSAERGSKPGRQANKPRPRWEHRCPVCHSRRMAGRPVPEWRCAECLGAGLSGKLVITKLAPSKKGPAR